MKAKLECLLDNGNNLRFENIETKHFGYFDFKMQCLTLDQLCTAVLGVIFFRFASVLKLVYFSDLLGFKYG